MPDTPWAGLARNPDGSPRLLFQDRAAYVEGEPDPGGPVPDEKRQPVKAGTRPDDSKPDDSKPDDSKPDDSKPETPDESAAQAKADALAREEQLDAREAAIAEREAAFEERVAQDARERLAEAVADQTSPPQGQMTVGRPPVVPPGNPLVEPPVQAPLGAAPLPPGAPDPTVGALPWEPPAPPPPGVSPVPTGHLSSEPTAGAPGIEWEPAVEMVANLTGQPQVREIPGFVVLTADVWETVYPPGSVTPTSRLVHPKGARIPLAAAEALRAAHAAA